ncbi:serine acetyltransferase [Modestobacter sp. SYSU DS0657]
MERNLQTREFVMQDWTRNAGRPKSRAFLVLFRAAQYTRLRWGRRSPVALVCAVLSRGLGELVLSMEIPIATQVGPGLRIDHGGGLVINARTIIGARVTLRHNVTIGNSGSSDVCPWIGDDVSVGAGATILGGVRVGAGAKVGAQSLVVQDVPEGAVTLAPLARVRSS